MTMVTCLQSDCPHEGEEEKQAGDCLAHSVFLPGEGPIPAPGCPAPDVPSCSGGAPPSAWWGRPPHSAPASLQGRRGAGQPTGPTRDFAPCVGATQATARNSPSAVARMDRSGFPEGLLNDGGSVIPTGWVPESLSCRVLPVPLPSGLRPSGSALAHAGG